MIKRLFVIYILFVTGSGFRFGSNQRISPTSSLTSCKLDQRDSTSSVIWSAFKRSVAVIAIIPTLLCAPVLSRSDDELARYAAEGNAVGVDGQCFMKKCAIETSKCAYDPSCLKGLACLARCKGGSLCSTGCFAKYGSDQLDGLLYCSVEKNDCVQVPGKENLGWTKDTLADLPSKPLENFDIKSLDGTWYKIMGLDSRYDCFDCQRNSFQVTDSNTVKMEAVFRIPRPTFPGYLQSRIEEELHSGKDATIPLPSLQSQGKMFGLTFWENWYILGEHTPRGTESFGVASAFAAAKESTPDMKLVFYTGHTLQGSYKGAFLYSRSPDLTSGQLDAAKAVIGKAGLDPSSFCIIRNQCFLPSRVSEGIEKDKDSNKKTQMQQDLVNSDPTKKKQFWFLGQSFFRDTKRIATELADWFEDPAILSDWLYSQQQHMVFEQPLMAETPLSRIYCIFYHHLLQVARVRYAEKAKLRTPLIIPFIDGTAAALSGCCTVGALLLVLSINRYARTDPSYDMALC